MPRFLIASTVVAMLATVCGCGPKKPRLDVDTSVPGKDSAVVVGTDAGTLEDDVSASIEAVRAAHDLPGLAAGVVSATDLVALGATGVRRYGDATVVAMNDRWHLGSETKAMTATLTAVLVEDGTVTWETTLPEAFPALAAGFDPAYATVTLEQLLQHRGGLPTAVPSGIWSSLWSDTRPLPEQRTWFVEQMLAVAPAVPVGTYEYSNSGYMIVGAALEAATGMQWEALMELRLFAPLAMDECGFGPPASPGVVDNPWGHNSGGTAPEPVDPGASGADNPPALGPAGTVHCSMASWARFLAEHIKGARGKSTFLSNGSYTRMHTPPPGGDYALGWSVTDRTWAGGTVLTHAGSNTMFFAVTWVAPNIERAFFAATNIAGSEAPTALDEVMGVLIPIYK